MKRGRGFLIQHRSPTLSYTQRLENRVAELEAALSKTGRANSVNAVNDSPNSSASPRLTEYESAASPDASGSVRSSRMSFPDSTSLFELPGRMRQHVIVDDQPDPELAAKKERLVNSAWRERAFERLSDTPVRSDGARMFSISSYVDRNHTDGLWIHTFVGYSRSSTSSTGLHLHVRPPPCIKPLITNSVV